MQSRTMTLAEWLEWTGRRRDWLAALLGADPASVSRWASGRQRPGFDTRHHIHLVTHGMVHLEDSWR